MIRHFLPEKITQFILRHGWIIKPGLETLEPEQAANRYLEFLEKNKIRYVGTRILILGYGGNYAVAARLLEKGVEFVTLNDPFAAPDDSRNKLLVPEYGKYFSSSTGRVIPKKEFIHLHHASIIDARIADVKGPFDLVFSSSVYEHLEDPDRITSSLKDLLNSKGAIISTIDLRDHYFRKPFEMLCYTEEAWRNWLNPTSNLNRWRLRNYRSMFKKHFPNVLIEVLNRDEVEFIRACPRIKDEFLSGDISEDSVCMIRVLAQKSGKTQPD
jgi:SAM-dependent methyltransferase